MCFYCADDFRLNVILKFYTFCDEFLNSIDLIQKACFALYFRPVWEHRMVSDTPYMTPQGQMQYVRILQIIWISFYSHAI